MAAGFWHNISHGMRNFVALLAAFVVAIESFVIVVFGLSVTFVSSLNWEQTIFPASQNDVGVEFHPGFVALLWTAVAMLAATCWVAVLSILRSRQTVVKDWRLAAVVAVGLANGGGMAICAGLVAGGSWNVMTLLAVCPLTLVAALAVTVFVERVSPGFQPRSKPGANVQNS